MSCGLLDQCSITFRFKEFQRKWNLAARLAIGSAEGNRRVYLAFNASALPLTHKPLVIHTSRVIKIVDAIPLLAFVVSAAGDQIKVRRAIERVDNAYEWILDTHDPRELIGSQRFRVLMRIKFHSTTSIFHAQWGPRLFSGNNLWSCLCQLLRSPENFLSKYIVKCARICIGNLNR